MALKIECLNSPKQESYKQMIDYLKEMMNFKHISEYD